MRFHKNVPVEHQEILLEQLKKYKKEIKMTKEEQRDLEKWVASGHSPYDNGDYIYTEYGYPMDFVNAMRFFNEIIEKMRSMSEEELDKFLREQNGDYDRTLEKSGELEKNRKYFSTDEIEPLMDKLGDEELPFN